jgi:hypothetical protein
LDNSNGVGLAFQGRQGKVDYMQFDFYSERSPGMIMRGTAAKAIAQSIADYGLVVTN